ncbi:hypothetical protein CRE_08129 [Caenorhabditis remanei]|uniref:Uncharacterized protein n=2 Tax=Caenorhabditis remanei TaxID=31234 RepID=E3M3J8_CAERE|nr:hypothetical protein CRE_08129 [Caenorhabditis remanei]
MIISMCDDRAKDLIAEQETEPREKSEIHKKVLEFIGKRYEVHLTDGRYIRGTLIATDKDANMVFNKADERWTPSADQGTRYLGQAMISKKYVARMFPLSEPEPARNPEEVKETEI